jgi:hypothetical protein
VERAWRAVKVATEGLSDKIARSDGHLWKRVERLMAKAEARRLRALAGQEEHLVSDPALIQDTQPFPGHDGDLRPFEIGAESLDALGARAPHGEPTEPLGDADTCYQPNPRIPTEDVMYIGGPSENAEYSTVAFGVQAANPALCSAVSEFTDPFSSLGGMGHAAGTDSLDWVMQDDMGNQLGFPQPTNSDLDEFPITLGEWAH